jgi:hypothetical protein
MIGVIAILLAWLSWGIDEPVLNKEKPLQGKFEGLAY